MSLIEYDGVLRVELIKHNVSDLDVARAAWVSNLGEEAKEKESDGVEGLINFLYRNKHMSPFEHGGFTFFVDVPIFVAREFMRHRTFSYNEVSGRYKELTPRFYLPKDDRPLVQTGKIGSYNFIPGSPGQHDLTHTHAKAAYEQAWFSYRETLDQGVAREVARNVLPVGIYTQFYATCNLRNLMQFLVLRNSGDALTEIRDIAEQMEDYLEECAPFTYKAYRAGREAAETDYKALYEELLDRYNSLEKQLEGAQLAMDSYWDNEDWE